MRIRPYIACKDYDEIKNWISDERTNAMWCANLIHFPIEKDNFEEVLDGVAQRFGDSPYVATSEDGKLIGFFCYSVNLETNEGMLKFVVTNPDSPVGKALIGAKTGDTVSVETQEGEIKYRVLEIQRSSAV